MSGSLSLSVCLSLARVSLLPFSSCSAWIWIWILDLDLGLGFFNRADEEISWYLVVSRFLVGVDYLKRQSRAPGAVSYWQPVLV